jgi:hypothetical protein
MLHIGHPVELPFARTGPRPLRLTGRHAGEPEHGMELDRVRRCSQEGEASRRLNSAISASSRFQGKHDHLETVCYSTGRKLLPHARSVRF